MRHFIFHKRLYPVIAFLLMAFAAAADTVVSREARTLSWETNITYPASLFSGMQAGSRLKIAFSNTSASYHKFKLYAQTSSWATLGSGEVSGATIANGEFTPSGGSGTIVYTVTDLEAAQLKGCGMAANGYGVTITGIVIAGPDAVPSGSSGQTVFSGSHDLANWASFSIDKVNFMDIAAGSTISITTAASSAVGNPSYLNIKLYTGTWQPLSAGSIGGNASKNGDLIVPKSAAGTFSYTLNASEAAAIRTSGLIVQGHAMTVTNVSLSGGSSSGSGTAGGGAVSGTAAANPAPATQTGTPYANHGALHVSGAYLYDKNNKKYQLYGMSTHGLSWFGNYVTKEGLRTLRDDWNTNCIRLVLYPRDYNGYLTGGNQAQLRQLVCDGIDYATELGMYVLVDWHVHNYNPRETQSEAIAFLKEISAKYKNYGNVLYEICNEPTGSPWNSAIKPYAEAVIPAIRANAPDAVIIVGTNTWSQDVEEALANPLGRYRNIMYTFHFYANTHTDSYRSRVESAVQKGLPIFITEFGTCDASGNGGFNAAQSQAWFDLLKKHNISHCNWSLCNKGETASALQSWCDKTSGWSEGDLTESGRLVRQHFRSLTR